MKVSTAVQTLIALIEDPPIALLSEPTSHWDTQLCSPHTDMKLLFWKFKEKQYYSVGMEIMFIYNSTCILPTGNI